MYVPNKQLHDEYVNYRSYSKIQKLFSFDAETNGLWGQPFSIGAVVTERGIPVDQFIGTCPIEGEVNEWVEQNVLPQCGEITHPDLPSLLADFGKFYYKHREGAMFIAHMGYIVEAYLLRLMFEQGVIDVWDAPFPLHDVASIIYGVDGNAPDDRKRFIPTSVDESLLVYKRAHHEHLIRLKDAYADATKEIDGKTHNPLWDSYQAAKLVSLMFMQ
jgi:hypothetical protein